MPRQQQVDAALARAFRGVEPNGKCRALLEGARLIFYHYHHHLLTWDLRSGEPSFLAFDPEKALPAAWKPTDKRILTAALEALRADGQSLWRGAGGAVPKAAAGAASAAPAAVAAGSAAAGSALPQEPLHLEQRLALGGGHGEVTLAVGHSVEEQGSRFLALLACPVRTRAAAAAALGLLRGRGELRGATHRIAGCRLTDGYEAWEDDGESGAGAALRAALKREGAIDCVVVVARWYGGVNIGKARFRHVQERAAVLLHAVGAARLAGGVDWRRAGSGHRLGMAEDWPDVAAPAAASAAAPTATAAPKALPASTPPTSAAVRAACAAADEKRARAAAAAEARLGKRPAEGAAVADAKRQCGAGTA